MNYHLCNELLTAKWNRRLTTTRLDYELGCKIELPELPELQWNRRL